MIVTSTGRLWGDEWCSCGHPRSGFWVSSSRSIRRHSGSGRDTLRALRVRRGHTEKLAGSHGESGGDTRRKWRGHTGLYSRVTASCCVWDTRDSGVVCAVPPVLRHRSDQMWGHSVAGVTTASGQDRHATPNVTPYKAGRQPAPGKGHSNTGRHSRMRGHTNLRAGAAGTQSLCVRAPPPVCSAAGRAVQREYGERERGGGVLPADLVSLGIIQRMKWGAVAFRVVIRPFSCS